MTTAWIANTNHTVLQQAPVVATVTPIFIVDQQPRDGVGDAKVDH